MHKLSLYSCISSNKVKSVMFPYREINIKLSESTIISFKTKVKYMQFQQQANISKLNELDLELIESMSVYKSALGNLSITMSPNSMDLECYIISKDGEILRHDTILWEDSYFMPSALQYVHLYECYPDMNFYQAWEHRINENPQL